MPSESDNKMEELLKAYAKKRQEEAGSPLELHPATRKVLQGEIAKQWPKAAGKSRSVFELLGKFWPRLAFAAALLVGLGVIIRLSSTKPAAEQQLAQNGKQTEKFFADERASKDSPARNEPEARTLKRDLTPSPQPESKTAGGAQPDFAEKEVLLQRAMRERGLGVL